MAGKCQNDTHDSWNRIYNYSNCILVVILVERPRDSDQTGVGAKWQEVEQEQD